MSTENTYEKLLKAVKEYKRADVIKLLSEGVVVDIPKEEMNSVISSIVGLRDIQVMDALVKVVKPLKAGMLELDMKNKNNQDFIGVVVNKYISFFDVNNSEEMDALFEMACESGNVTAVSSMMKKGIGTGAISKLGASYGEVFNLLKKINPSTLTPEQRLDIYTQAATSFDGISKITNLAKWGYDVKETIPSGNSLKKVLANRINEDKYSNNKSGVAAKQRDKSTLSALDKINSIGKPYKSPVKPILIGLAAIAVIIGVIFAYPYVKKAVTPQKDTIELGDTVELAFDVYVNGEIYEDASTKSYELEIGSNTFLDGFEEQLIGHKVGDDVDVKVTFPDDYFVDSTDYYHVVVEQGEGILAGKDAIFRVHIKDIIE